MTTNTTKKAAGATNTNGLPTDTDAAYSPTVGATGQTPVSRAIASSVQAMYCWCRAAMRGFYVDRSIGIETIAMLTIVAAIAGLRAIQ